MIFNKKEIQLKDGRKALFRSPCEEDAEEMLQFIRKASGETDFLMAYPEEYADFTLEQEKEFLSSNYNNKNGMEFTATQWTQKEIADAKTPDRLPPSDKTVLELDIFQAPLGGNSCGPVPLEQHITRAGRNTTFKLDYTLIIR